jgi:hypothetical protein
MEASAPHWNMQSRKLNEELFMADATGMVWEDGPERELDESHPIVMKPVPLKE